MARDIVYTCGKEQFGKAEELTQDYLSHLKKEYEYALVAVKVVENWLHKNPINDVRQYTRKEVARLLDITPEAVRNWERNGLIDVPRLENGFRIYGEKEVEQLRVIRSLRSAHYSINSIHRLLSQIHRPSPNIIEILNSPTENEDIVTVTDRLVKSLEEAIEGANETLALFKK
nr:MerR family transcriptional regulator [Bacillus alkalicola]